MKTMTFLLDCLEKSLIEEHIALSVKTNPVFSNFDSYTYEKKLYTTGQYSLFSRYITTFLTEISIKTGMNDKYKEISNEMAENVNEELGGDSKTFPHYSLLCNGFMKGLGINIYEISPSQSTFNFYSSVLKNIKSGSESFAAGFAYALESSAVPELKITDRLVSSLFIEKNVKIPSEIDCFFRSHINCIEISHQVRLKIACINCIKSHDDMKEFERGFNVLMSLMDRWWTDLNKETCNNQK